MDSSMPLHCPSSAFSRSIICLFIHAKYVCQTNPEKAWKIPLNCIGTTEKLMALTTGQYWNADFKLCGRVCCKCSHVLARLWPDKIHCMLKK